MLNIVVALPEEARPLIHYFKMQRWHDVRQFAIYRSDEIRLIVSGIGKLASATATGFLAGQQYTDPSAWLNLGIAGGDAGVVGDIILANEIVDSVSRSKYFPSVCFDLPVQLTRVITVQEQQTKYTADCVYDMEASGFFSAALRFSTAELIHSIKVISDNSISGVEMVSKEHVAEMIDRKLPVVGKVCNWLLNIVGKLTDEYAGKDEYDKILAKFHFTYTQQRKLKAILQNWFSMTDVSPLQFIKLCEIRNAQSFLNELEMKIRELPVNYQ